MMVERGLVIVILWSKSFPCVWTLNVPVCMYVYMGKEKKYRNFFFFFLVWFGSGTLARRFCKTGVVLELSACRVVIGWEGLILVNVSYRATGLWERQSVHNVFVLLVFVLVTALLLLLLGHPCYVSVTIYNVLYVLAVIV